MSHSTLYLRLSESNSACEWLLLAGDGRRRSGRSALAEIAGESHGARLVVLVPATAVTIAEVTLPPVKRTQQRQAALFALEDQLVDDPAELHAALGERNEHGTIPLVVVSRVQMEGWLARLAEHQLRPDQLLVDVLALPFTAGAWSLLWEDDDIRLRTGISSGYGFETEQWPLLWPRLLAEAGEQAPQRMRLFDGRHNVQERLMVDDALPNGTVEYLDNSDAMQWLGDDSGSSRAINLLQGDYGRREQWGRLLRPWRPAAALLLVWLSLQGGMALFDLHHLRSEELRLEQQMAELYRATFPDARKVVDPLAQMKQRLAALQNGDNGFMGLVASAAPVLTGQTIQMKGMRYQDGVLDLDVSVNDMAALDGLRAALSAKGLKVEIGNTSNQGGRVESRLTLRGGAA